MSTQDPGLIRLVASRYLADSVWPLAFVVTVSLITELSHMIYYLIAFTLYLVARWTWLNQRVERYYAARFGRTGSVSFPPSDLGLQLSVVIFQNSALRDMFHAPAYVRVALT